MAPISLQKAIGAVKDQTSIGLARVNSSNSSYTSLHVAIVKATRHDEHPTDDRYPREILLLTARSPSLASACVAALSRRLSRTRSWPVALKTLLLVHRLLSEGDPSFHQELFFSTHRGTRFLDLSDFRHSSRSSASFDFSAFVRLFARYLDECLEFRMHHRRHLRRRTPRTSPEWAEGEERSSDVSGGGGDGTPARDMKTERLFVRTQYLQLLLDRFLACQPTGAAKTSRLVAVALYPLVKESYQIYYDLAEIISVFVDRFMTLPIPDCVWVYDVFRRLSKQLEELELFYGWCRSAGISHPSELPDVEGITPKQLDVMDDFIQQRSIMSSQKSVKLDVSELPIEEEESYHHEFTETKLLQLPSPSAAEVEEIKEKEEQPAVEDVDLLDLKEEAVRGEDHGDKLALALFDGNQETISGSAEASAWDAFPESNDWETALVQSASHLSVQKPALGGGLDMLLFDGMYRQTAAASTAAGGSASSMLCGAVAMPGILAPPGAGGLGDPFAASLAVAPPSWVQMAEMERKQRMLVEEQQMWQQYVAGGMQGQFGMPRIHAGQPYASFMGSYTHTF